MQKFTAIVPNELDGVRLDKALSSLYPEHSRSRLQTWIKNGQVIVNDMVLRQKDSVRAGQSIVITPVYEPAERHQGEAIPLDIIYEDDEILVINKPAGLIVHPGAGNPEHTLMNGLLYHDPVLDQVPRAGIVQRLDKDTSGIMVVAKTPPSHTWLVNQLKKREIRREYQAIVWGAMTAGGCINAPMGRHRIHRKRMTVNESGKQAITHYRIIKNYRSFTHIMARLETGRTHQIRVHMAYLGHPVVGDSVYGGRKKASKDTSPPLAGLVNTFPRQALHAYRINLIHPGSGNSMNWIASLPEDMQSLINALDKEC